MLSDYSVVSSSWRRYVEHGVIDKVSPVVARSWRRSATHHNPLEKAAIDKLESHRFRERLEQNSLLMEVAVPVMQEIQQSIQGSGCLVILTDASGYILKALGDDHFYTKAAQVNLSEGVCWDERVKGTNAIGTSLVEKQPVSIFAQEHFYRENHFLTCAASPIFDLEGNLIGVLDISGDYRGAHPHSLGLVVAGSRAIQSKLVVRQMQQKKQCLQLSGYEARYTFERIISCSEAMKALLHQARKVAKSNAPVLILGESGTGKELVAQAIHNASSRAGGPFIAVNCGAVPKELIEAELFGYEEGAFTGARKGGAPGKFELARGGTLFLDEIGDMPLEVQATLLRVLQEKQFAPLGGHKLIPLNVRMVAATNKDLFQLVNNGKFRLDLYYRINVLSLTLPPLRERREDVEALVNHFLARLKAGARRQELALSEEVMQLFKSYAWPGNVRELINVLERAVTMVDEDIIMPKHLPREMFVQCQTAVNDAVNLEDVERASIQKALRLCDGNVSRAARELGIGRTTLYRKLKKYKIDQ